LRLSDAHSQDQVRREVETLAELAKKHQRW
jgi:hypothetical protein